MGRLGEEVAVENRVERDDLKGKGMVEVSGLVGEG